MTDAVGPIFAAGFQDITESGYEILYLPDLHNDELQREGKAPVYWWLPNAVRLARKGGDTGDYKFSFIHFAGVRSESTTVGVTGKEEVAGGLVGFSTTTAPPASALKASQDSLLDRFRGNDDRYWGWRTPVAPMFRPAPIVSNTTTVTNLSPTATQPPAPSPDGAGPGPGRGLNPHQPPRRLGRGAGIARGFPPPVHDYSKMPVFRSPKGTVLRDTAPGNLDMWYCNLQGQGAGSISPFAENAYSGLVGSLPAALIWQSFHGGTSAISVWQYMKIKVWSPVVRIHLHGEWDRVQDHFSAAGHYGGLFWGGDIQAEFNNLRMSGGIDVEIEVDTTLPNADKLQESMEKRSDMVFQKFMDEAQNVIFDPAPFNEKPAEASGGFLGFGGGVAFKLRHDQTHLTLDYNERREMAYLESYPVSGQLEGLYDELKTDPAAEKKYFTTIDIGDWDRKVVRAVKPVVNWPDPAQDWVGEPVAFLSTQIGYPNADGVLQWDGHIFQSSDPPDFVWQTETFMKAQADVKNPPPGWTPDKTFVKRQVHFTEPPSDVENPFVRVQVEKNVVDLDPGDVGRPVDDINLEVRVDNVGALTVGPIFLNVDLESAKQIVEVTFTAEGSREDGNARVPVKFSWEYDDQDKPRYWMLFTGQPEFMPRYSYQVRVIVKGSIFTKGQEWTGPPVQASASGPLMVSVPTPEDQGVETKALPEVASIVSQNGHHPPGRTAPPSRRAVGVGAGTHTFESSGYSISIPESQKPPRTPEWAPTARPRKTAPKTNAPSGAPAETDESIFSHGIRVPG
jgi:hypothetical protein